MTATFTYDRWAGSPYLRWNDALGRHFFHPGLSGQRVWLTASPALLDQVGSALGSGTEELVGVLRQGPPWNSVPGQLCRNALNAADAWRARRNPAPPYPLYLGYLCLFAAAGTTGDGAVRVNAYYPRLQQLAGLPQPGAPPLFEKMTELWGDLERWSAADCEGLLGVFRAAGVGRQRHIGLPLAQNLITPAERRALPAAFTAAGLRGAPPASTDQLAEIMSRTGLPALARVRALLAEAAPRSDRELLLGLLEEALHEWLRQPPPASITPASPTSAGSPPPPRPAALPSRGRLALAARLDRAAGTAHVFLRAHLEPFPPRSLQLTTASGALLTCDEQAADWSSPLTAPTGTEVAASTLGDWLPGQSLREVDLAFRIALPAGPLRVLQPGHLSGLPHLLETHELQAGEQATLLAHRSCWPAVHDWGQHAADFRELRVTGLPDGWHLATAHRCPPPGPLQHLLAWLPGTAAPRLILDGGLRAAAGSRNVYLDFARPAVRLLGGTGLEKLAAGPHELPADDDGRHQLPLSLGPGEHRVQALAEDGSTTAEIRIELLTVSAPVAAPPPARRSAAPWRGRRDLLLAADLWPVHARHGWRAQRMTLLTRSGRAGSWLTTAPPPHEERPAWAVPDGYRPQAAYVGNGEPDSEAPLPNGPDPAWVDLLTGRLAGTGEVLPPGDPVLARLWHIYVQAARAQR